MQENRFYFYTVGDDKSKWYSSFKDAHRAAKSGEWICINAHNGNLWVGIALVMIKGSVNKYGVDMLGIYRRGLERIKDYKRYANYKSIKC